MKTIKIPGKFSVIALLLIIKGATACAQTTDYERIKAQADASSLPLVNICVEIDKVCKPTYTSATIEIHDPQKRTDTENATTDFNCKVKYRGNTSLAYDKKSFNVKLLNESGKSLDANILGIRSDDAWILDAMTADRMRMRNRLLFDIWNDFSGTPYPTDYENRNGTRGYFVEVFINGGYQGLYCMSDKINRKLLGIKKAKTDDEGKLGKLNGVIYKCNQWGDAAKFSGYEEQDMNGEEWNSWELVYPDDFPCEETYTPLKEFIDYCAVSSNEDFEKGLDKHLWLDNFTDYQLFAATFGLYDNTMKNTHLSTVNINEGRRMMITPWDLDRSLGGIKNDHINEVSIKSIEDMHLYVKPYMRLWTDNIDNYRNAVACRWKQLYAKGILTSESFNRRVDAYVEQFVNSGAWQRERNKWNGNIVELTESPEEEAQYLKQWYKMNVGHLRDNIFKDLGPNGISSCKAEKTTAVQTKKNLLGQNVADSYKGIIIFNGKKVMQE